MFKRSRGETSPGSLLALVIIILLVFGGSCVVQRATKDTTTFTVDRRERVVNGDSSKYLVWITREDGSTETLECTDTLAFGKFNSSDLYGRLKEGKRFRATVAGYRFGCTSSYRNIISIDEELPPAASPPKTGS